MREVLPAMKQRGWGRILNIGSGAAKGSAIARAGSYSASKAALEMLTKSLTSKTEGSGIMANNVRPGVVDTQMRHEIRSTPEESAGSVTYNRFHTMQQSGTLTDPLRVGEQIVAILFTDKHGEILDVREMPDE